MPWPPAFDPAAVLLFDGGRTFAAPPVAFFIACSCSQLSYCAFDRIGCSPPVEFISEALITPPTAACPPTLASTELLRLICY